jgi:hypothetical protein
LSQLALYTPELRLGEGSENEGTVRPAKVGLSISVHCLPGPGSKGVSTGAWEPRPAESEQGSTSWQGWEMSTTPSSPPPPAPVLSPARVAVPAVAPILAPPHPVGRTTTEHFPEMNPLLAPADPPRPQSTWFPRAPSPAGGSAGRPLNARLP